MPAPPDEFSPSEVFSIFLKYFRQPKAAELSDIKAIFRKIVKSEEKWLWLLDQLEIAKEDNTLTYPKKFLLSIRLLEKEEEEEKAEPSEEIPVAPVARFAPNSDEAIKAELDGDSLYTISVPDQQVKDVCIRILKTWPPNLEYPERPSDAYAALKAAARTIPLADIETVCGFYTETFNDPSSGLVSPYHLKTFVSREDLFAEWRLRARNMPKSEDLEIFNATWAWYPPFANREVSKTIKDSQSFWFRHILPEDRWRFLSAVKQLRDSKRDLRFIDREDQTSVEKYTPSMVSFIGTWRETKYFRMMSRDMASGSYPVLKAENFFDTPDLYTLSIALDRSYYGKLMLRYDGDARATFADVLRYIRSEHERFKKPARPEFASEEAFEAFVDVLYKAGWEFACRPPRVVVVCKK